METGMNQDREVVSVPYGFTLIELLVVIGIITVFVMMALPGFMGLSPRARLKEAARGIVTDLQQTRMEALKRSTTWGVHFETDSSRYRIVSDDGADGTWGTADDPAEATVNLGQYESISFGSGYGAMAGAASPSIGVSANDEIILFRRDGTSDTGTIYIQDTDGNTFAIEVSSQSGNVRTWRNYGSGWEE